MRAFSHFILIFALTLATAVHAERIRADGNVEFYVNPTGDDSRDCLSEAAPCRTMQRAYGRAYSEYDFVGSGCVIKLSDGIHTNGVRMTGTLVGAHICHVVGNPTDRRRVIVQPAPGTAAFDIQDLAMISVTDLTIQGDGIIGFFGRQLVVVDIARVTFGSMPDGIAVSMTDQAGANLVGDFCIDGDMSAFLSANHMSRIKVAAGVSINMEKAVKIQYFAMSYTNSIINFGGAVQFKNSKLISGQQYRTYWNGIINTNGLVLPGNITGEAALGGRAY